MAIATPPFRLSLSVRRTVYDKGIRTYVGYRELLACWQLEWLQFSDAGIGFAIYASDVLPLRQLVVEISAGNGYRLRR